MSHKADIGGLLSIPLHLDFAVNLSLISASAEFTFLLTVTVEVLDR